MKEFLKSLFGISGKEISGFLVLLLLVILIILYPKLYEIFSKNNNDHSVDDHRILDSLVSLLEQPATIMPTEKFQFNPNSTTEDSLVLLGFSRTTAKQIINYREKGGRFRIKADLFRIYSSDTLHIRSIYPYIDLPEEFVYTQPTRYPEKKNLDNSNQDKVNKKINKVTLPKFDINQADTSVLQTINGIGSVLSNRIIVFRDKLGGFVDIQQLQEVYNLDSTALVKLTDMSFVDNQFVPAKIMINSSSEDELGNHPYISRTQARLLIAYRNQHGIFRSIDDLQDVYSFDENTINRIEPYISWSTSN